MITGIDLIETGFILYVVNIIVIALVVSSFAKILQEKGYRLAWSAALLFPCLFFNHLFAIIQFSRTSLAFTYLFLFFFIFMRRREQNDILMYIMVVLIVITHPFQSIAMLAIILVYILFSNLSRARPVNLAFFSIKEESL